MQRIARAGRVVAEHPVKAACGHVGRQIGALARPDAIYVADALPKTRSGKIMRRFLRQVAAGQQISGDTSTLEDPSVLERLAATPAQ